MPTIYFQGRGRPGRARVRVRARGGHKLDRDEMRQARARRAEDAHKVVRSCVQVVKLSR
jgi:predicted ABC-type ATPase